MRLTLSLCIWLAVLTAGVLGVHGWLQLRAEEADLVSVARRELALITTAVRGSVENAARDSQEPDVQVLLEQLELKDPALDVYVFAVDGSLTRSSRGSDARLLQAKEIATRSAATEDLRTAELPTGEMAAVAPVRIAGEVRGRLVVLRPSSVLRADLVAEQRAMAISIGVLIAVLSGVIWSVIQVRVHRPLSQMIAVVRRMGAGELSARIRLPGKDEIAELAREFDAMAEGLERTRRQLASEAESREKLQLEMQRANRMAIAGELAATLAHEIGSPLQVLHGRALDLSVNADLPPGARRSAGILVEQTERVHQIVERFLDVARRKAPRFEEVDIIESVRSIVELCTTQARRMGVRLEVEKSPVPRLRGDPAQVQQVLLNLLQNALRASFRGGVVTIGVFNSSFRNVASSRDQPSVKVSIEDAGIGIAEEARIHVFEPFFTGWEDEAGSGTGLGLAVVRSIVTDHGGIVGFEPGADSVGTRFVVHFPTILPIPPASEGAA